MRRLAGCALIVSALLATGCQKEATAGLQLSAEGMGGNNSKMYVDGLNSYWMTGDEVNINGTAYSVTAGGSSATVAGTFSDDTYMMVFPASIYQSSAGSTVTVNLPDTYQYRTDGAGHQVVDAPMAYYGSAAGGKATLKHLTGAMNVTVTSPTGAFYLDRITVESVSSTDAERYQMSGTFSIDLSDIDGYTGVPNAMTAPNHSVTMRFDEETFRLDYNVSKTIQIPVPTSQNNTYYSITVEGHSAGTRYVFTRQQSSRGVLGRAKLAYAAANMLSDGSHTTSGPRFDVVTDDGVDYYLIQSARDLQVLDTMVKTTSSYNGQYYSYANYRLSGSIDMSGVEMHTLRGMRGIFDGNNKTLSNLTVRACYNYPNELGLFTQPNGLQVKNLTIAGLTVNPGDAAISTLYLGGFCSLKQGTVDLTDCSLAFATGMNLSGSSSMFVGGIASGYNSSSTLNATRVSIDFGNATFTQTSDYNYLYFGGAMGYHAVSGHTLNFSGCTVRGTVNTVYTGHSQSTYLRAYTVIGYRNDGTSYNYPLSEIDATTNFTVMKNGVSVTE
ncbi:MAG: hypothetical protein IJ524_02365 [Bacteroidales bacterium]|nr:hypothetical protein [Bacteroidales bacterium]